MKQLILILLTIVCSPVCAQSGLHINQLFEGKMVPAKEMVETRIRGKAISQYKLTFFHSVRFKCDEEVVKKVDHLAARDFAENGYADKHGDSESSSCLIRLDDAQVGKSRVKARKSTITQMYRLRSRDKTNRYLCYKVIGDTMTVIYLEGTITSLDELKKIFND